MTLADLPDDWQHKDLAKAIKWTDKRGLAIDCGAHRGITTRFLKQHFAQVVAIEPQAHLAAQIVADQVINAAVSYEPGLCGLEDGRWNTGQCHVAEGDSTDVITLDSLGLAPDFIKIDIEGYEFNALLGGVKTIQEHKPVIMLEENGNNRRYGIDDNACKALLESWGYEHVETYYGEAPDTDQVFVWRG